MPSRSSKAIKINPMYENDLISKLPDELLQMILLRLSLEDAMKTSVLSSRWVELWKCRPHIVLNMGRTLVTTPPNFKHEVSVRLAKEMTKVIMNHRGNLKSCTLHHYSSQCNDGKLQSWIDTVTCVKHANDLGLVNHGDSMLRLLPNAFSHQSLSSLSLSRYTLMNTSAFKNCSNLKTLKLLNIIIPQVSVLSNVFESCSSLEVLVMQINPLTRSGVLKIDNNKLKFLQISCAYRFDRIEVYTTSLDVLDIRLIKCERDNFILDAPNIRFNRFYWIAGSFPHISYNISFLAQEKRRIWHDLMVNDFYDMRRSGCLSVSVDLTNSIEVEILKEVLLMWTTEMIDLELFFKKNNTPREEGECSINAKAHKKILEDAKAFPNADFRVNTVWMYNFDGSNEEEIVLASHFVTQKIVTEKMMIKTSSFPPVKKLKVEAYVAKLMELPKGSESVSIECF